MNDKLYVGEEGAKGGRDGIVALIHRRTAEYALFIFIFNTKVINF